MADDAFTFVDNEPQGNKPPVVFEDFLKLHSEGTSFTDFPLVTALRQKHPELTVTTVPSVNCNLLRFAAAGYAQAELEDDAEPVIRYRYFEGPSHRGGSGRLADNVWFAKYNYVWNNENFILYTAINFRYGMMQYILKEPGDGETTMSHSAVVDRLLNTIGAWLIREVPAIYVYDGYWTRSTKLWEEVRKAKWEDVILDPKMKKAISEVASKFFDSKEIYEDYGVPWKRGLIFYGPVGNGKTISLKALMHTLQERKQPVVTLYVKEARGAYNIRSVFQMARAMTPCMLVLEDIDTIVTDRTRSYFFNEVDGLENNDGILMIATTNHLDKLDPGLSKRPSRFDRKYLFPLPNKDERAQYAQYWRNKLKNKRNIDFPAKLCDAIADITEDFSFAYLKEAFVSTLLELARNQSGDDDDSDESGDEDDDPLNKYEFYRVFKAQVELLRKEMGSEAVTDAAPDAGASLGAYEQITTAYEEMVPMLEEMRLQLSSQHPGKAALSQGAAPRSVRDSQSVLSPFQFAPLARKDPGEGMGQWEL